MQSPGPQTRGRRNTLPGGSSSPFLQSNPRYHFTLECFYHLQVVRSVCFFRRHSLTFAVPGVHSNDGFLEAGHHLRLTNDELQRVQMLCRGKDRPVVEGARVVDTDPVAGLRAHSRIFSGTAEGSQRSCTAQYSCSQAIGFDEVIGSFVWGEDPYIDSIENWRKNREARLKADDGWLSVAGLFWLKQGKNTLGTYRSNNIVLPEGSAAAKAGILEHAAGKTTLRLSQNPGSVVEMKPDSEGEPTVVTIEDLSLFIIKRGERYALRLRDKNSPFRKKFTHLEWILSIPDSGSRRGLFLTPSLRNWWFLP